jgi:DNA mismatch repair ATPase MutS
MKVDRQTLRDLEVLPDATYGVTLVDHLDRTLTNGGRKAFARRLTSPLESLVDIREVQEAVRFLIGNEGVAGNVPREPELAAVSRHVESNLATLRRLRGPASWWEAAVVRIRYPDHHAAAFRGIALIRAFVARMESIERTLRDGPPLLARCSEEIRALISSRPLGEAISWNGTGWAWGSVLRSDRLIREEGRESVRNLVTVVHELDALISMAKVSRELDFPLPKMDEDAGVIELEALRHPFLDEPVENDLRLGPHERVVFLTGPNMAGKTTYLKACGVAVLLAHCGMGVPARSGRIGLVARLITAVRTEDSLWEGVSYFQAEARRVKRILDAVRADGPCVVIVDELFRGTNVKDAFDATTAVLKGFAKAEQSRFMVASHLAEVAGELEDQDAVLLRHFEASSDDGSVQFSYRVKHGLSVQRLGMEVLRREGVLDALDYLGSAAENDRPAH